MRFGLKEEHRNRMPVSRLCRIMDVSPRGYRAWRRRPMSRRQRRDLVVLAHIREQFRLSLRSYGRPRMTEELKELGLDVGHRRVGRLMRENGIAVKRNRKFKATTDSNHSFNIAPNLLERDFTADRPNRKWAGHQPCLDPRGLALPGCHPGPAFAARHRLGGEQPDETRPGDPGPEDGCCADRSRRRAASTTPTAAVSIVRMTRACPHLPCAPGACPFWQAIRVF